jgi:general secretion pathway protein D
MPPRPLRLIALAVAASLAASCTTRGPFIPEAVSVRRAPEAAAADGTRMPTVEVSSAPNETGFFQTPPLPAPGRSTAGARSAAAPNAANEKANTSLMFDQVPLNTFIETVYGAILKRNVSLDPQVASRQDLVSLRTGSPQTPAQVSELAGKLLKSYGLAVSDYGNMVRVTPDNAQAGYLPEIRRGRAMSEVPMALRPVFQLVELHAVTPQNVSNWLRTIFGAKVQVQDDMARQAILLSGQRDDVQAAMEAILMLDQPVMRGRTSARISPAFWSSEEMAKRLVDVLQAEGYQASTQANGPTPIVLLPIAPLNSIVVFAASPDVLNHVLRWAGDLDQPGQGRGSSGYFTYPVKNTDAEGLAKTLKEVMTPTSVATTSSSGQSGSTITNSRVVVNAATNSLIIQGSSSEYQQWLGLLQELDKPAKSALISVTVAEVALTDSEQLGFEWMLHQFSSNGYNVNAGSGVTVGTGGVIAPAISTSGGLLATISNSLGNPRVVINALASTNKVRVLSNPSIVTRNGETATIQVGSEVPILTSTQQAASTTATTVSTIQYRTTGVILKVRPVIHSSGRLELDVSQEVSSAATTTTGGTTSPTISTRKVDTKLTVVDGNTVLLGGLMSQTSGRSDSGVPWLKDLPVAGYLFKNNTDTLNRTELVVLITPNVINDDFDAQAVTDAFRSRFSWSDPARSTSWQGTVGAVIRGDTPLPGINLPGLDGAKKPAPKAPAARIAPPRDGAPALPAPAPQGEKPGVNSSASKPYVLPPVDAKAPAPAEKSADETPSQEAPLPPPPPPKADAPVTDEKTRQEILESIRDSLKGAKRKP